jgi:hypothetical protein
VAAFFQEGGQGQESGSAMSRAPPATWGKLQKLHLALPALVTAIWQNPGPP